MVHSEVAGVEPCDRAQPGRLPGPGRVRRREFEYIRYGIVSVTVAADVHTGQVVREELKRNDSAQFIRFRARLQRCTSTG
ncbi:hypothetical protein ACIGQE_28150 [Streptomyces sp. NPDC053429]|uniref:hypothetical protein n=1 Tax=Streptomyces sp. NPDC053429 TaxID=3365702 RepID=UPI0037D1DA96